MKLFNSLTKQKEEFTPFKKGEVKMYTCGPTVYNYAHIGNFFAYLSADTLYRWLKYGENHDVQWVLNITDVDDKTIRDSKLKYPELDPKEALTKFTRFYEEAFKKDLEKLNIPNSHFIAHPRATDFIEEQKVLVQKIIERGYAYEAEGSVYFDIQKYKQDYNYGRLVHIDEGFQAGARVDQDEYSEKSSAADFVLWKGKKEGEPFWEFELSPHPSPLPEGKGKEGVSLPGRPGWHLECTAMEKEILDFPFDIHTGGADLKFPHHEDEIAQAQAAYDVDPTKVWVHNGYLQVEGEKMSKSKGNFFLLSDLEVMGTNSELVRLTMVTNHYRKNFNFTNNGVHAIRKNLKDIRGVYKIALKAVGCATGENNDFVESYAKYKVDFKLAMQDDLNTSKAFTSFYLYCNAVWADGLITINNDINNNVDISTNHFIKTYSSDMFKEIIKFIDLASNVFGVDFKPQKLEIPQEVIDLVEQRKKAKQEKNFERSDALRDQVQSLGFSINDRTGEIIKL